MATKSKYLAGALLLTASLLTFLTFYRTIGAPSRSSYPQNNDSRDLPVVDYDTEITKEKSKTRKEKDERFKGRGNSDKRPIAELPDGVEPLPTNAHWWIGLSAIPVDQSDCPAGL